MSATTKQRLLLGLLAAAVVGAVWVQTRPSVPAASSRVAARPSNAAPAARGEHQGTSLETTAVRLDVLTASRNEPTGGGRNPFRFQPKPAPAPMRGAAGSGSGAIETPAVPSAPAPPPGPPPPPPIPLKFIGVVERASGVRWAVLSDSRATLYGREGDIIDGQYLIVRIGLESVEVSHADGRGRQTIRLTGQ